MALRTEAAVMRSLGLRRAGDGHFGGALAAGFGDAAAVGVSGGRGGAHGQREAEGFDDAGHGAGRAHDHAGADGGAEAAADEFDLGDVDVAGAVLRPEAAAIGAGAEDFALVMADDHGAGGQDDGGKVGAGGGHDLRGEGLVAAADEDDGVHGLRADHLLGVHRHQVAQEHGGGMGEALADGDGGEHHGQAAGEHDAALDAFDEVGDVAVAGIVVAEGVGDADDGAIERIVGVAHGLDEGFAEEEREAGVAVAGQPFA